MELEKFIYNLFWDHLILETVHLGEDNFGRQIVKATVENEFGDILEVVVKAKPGEKYNYVIRRERPEVALFVVE